MNHRFLSIVGLATTVALAGGCATNKEASSASTSSNKTTTETQTDVPVWAPKKHAFNPSHTRLHDLLHTTLRVSFDWQKQYLHGVAELTLKPYFYPQNTLVLDAKGFDVHHVYLMKGNDGTPLKFAYDGMKLAINLGRNYSRDEKYTVEIHYTAKPNELATGGSDAITQDKGLYFINPLGEDPDKPRQIWTQGETEASSAWFPTIDAPNERMTQDLYITIDKNFTTLSNGVLVYSRQNSDGTKTDYWKQELPHAPYLAMMAIGEYAVIKDKWRNLEVNYYVEPEYRNTAKKIFGNTPEMMEFFSKKLGVTYPWAKYSQVVVRDFVSGAMENTSASTFMEDLQLNERELLDKHWDGIIAHELFHQWFGNYVTTESWANLPLNEAFANYSEYIWTEHKYGADEAAYMQLDEMSQYLDESETKREPLIRYHYGDKEEMFDSHSYAKGGRVLHMLRKLVGDDAFYASLNRYLTQHKYTDVEIAELRMAFEDVTGQDLIWFFDQWFMKPGHPELQVTHSYQNGQVQLQVQQVQDTTYMPVYKLPVTVSVWANDKRTDHAIEITKASQTFTLPTSTTPQLVLFDGEKQLLGVVDHKKSEEELRYQFYNSKLLIPEFEALNAFSQNPSNNLKIIQDALKNDFWFIRGMALNALGEIRTDQQTSLVTQVQQIARTDKKGSVRSDAVLLLAEWGGEKYKATYEAALKDSSYQVVAAGIIAYAATGAEDAKQKLSVFDKEKNEDVVTALSSFYAMQAGPEKHDWFMQKLRQSKGSGTYYLLQSFSAYLASNSETNTLETITYLADLARNHNLYYVRMGAFQSLMVMSDKPGVEEMLKEISANEKDKRLTDMYKQAMQQRSN